MLGAALVITVAALSWFGKTKGETARLWIFLVQPSCLVVAGVIGAIFGARARLATTALVAAQLAIVLALKRYFDFW